MSRTDVKSEQQISGWAVLQSFHVYCRWTLVFPHRRLTLEKNIAKPFYAGSSVIPEEEMACSSLPHQSLTESID